MPQKNAFLRAVVAIDRVLKGIEIFLVGGSVIVMVIVLAGNFIFRNLFNASWTFAEEVGSFMLIIQTFAGLAYCARMGRHIRMSALFDQLPDKVKRVVMVLICIVTAVVLGYLAKLGVDWVIKTYVSNKVSSVLRVPMFIIYCVVPFGFIMALVQYVITCIKNITDRENIWVGTEATDFDAE